MKKKVRKLLGILIVGILVMFLFINYFSQIIISQNDMTNSSKVIFKQIDQIIKQNEEELEKSKEDIRNICILRARATAYLLQQDKSKINNLEEMRKIANLLEVDEIHIFNKEGVIYAGTEPKYYGLNMDSGDQISFFKPMLEDTSKSMCQDITANTAENKMMQYAATWTEDGDVIVQIGMKPSSVLEKIEKNKVSYIFSRLAETDGYTLIAVDPETNEIVGSTRDTLVNKYISDIGINTLLNPTWSKLYDVNIWLAAFGQIIFSLSVGEALALTYASYLPENSKLTDNVFLVVASNSAFEVCTAFGVFSILGFMSYTTGTPMVQLITEGTGLIFIVFPMIFNIMGAMGRILAPLLFLAILFAGITSALGLFEPMVNSTLTKLGWSRRKTTTILCIIGCIISVTLTTGISSYLIGIIDAFVNQFGVLLLIPIQAIIFGWIYGLDNVIPVLNEHSTIKVGRLWKAIIKYIAPVILFGLWGFGIFKLFSNANSFEITVYAIISIGVLALSLLFTKRKTPSNQN